MSQENGVSGISQVIMKDRNGWPGMGMVALTSPLFLRCVVGWLCTGFSESPGPAHLPWGQWGVDPAGGDHQGEGRARAWAGTGGSG